MAWWPACAQIATSPLLSQGSPTIIAGTKSQTWWPACGQNSYITPAISGVPKAHRGERITNGPVTLMWAK